MQNTKNDRELVTTKGTCYLCNQEITFLDIFPVDFCVKCLRNIYEQDIHTLGVDTTEKAFTISIQYINEMDTHQLEEHYQDLTVLMNRILSYSKKSGEQYRESISAEEYIDLLSEIIKMVKNGEAKNISIDSINKFVSSLVDLRPMDLCHANPCGAGDNMLVIDSQGKYRACDCVYNDYFLI